MTKPKELMSVEQLVSYIKVPEHLHLECQDAIKQWVAEVIGEGVVDPATIPLEEHGLTSEDGLFDHIAGQRYQQEQARKRAGLQRRAQRDYLARKRGEL